MARRKARKVRKAQLEPARIRLGLQQQEIADRLGVHVRTWAKWISGERPCPWPVWLAIKSMKPGSGKVGRWGKAWGKAGGRSRAGKKGA